TRVYDFRRAKATRGDYARSIRHFTMSQRGTVFDDEDALAADSSRIGNKNGGGSFDDLRAGVGVANVAPNGLDRFGTCRVNLVDDDDIGEAQVRFAGVIRQFVTGAVRVYNRDVEVSL